MGGHATVGSSGSLSSSVEAASSSEEGSFTVSPAPSGLANFMDPGSNWQSNVSKRSGCNRWASKYWIPGITTNYRSCIPRERRPCGLDVDEQALETYCRLHTAREEICTNQQHNHSKYSRSIEQGKKPLVVSTWSRVRDSSAARTAWYLWAPGAGPRKKSENHAEVWPPQAPGAPWGGTLSTLRVPGQTKESGSTHRVTWEPNPFISTKNVRREPYIPNGRGDGTHSFHPR